MINHVHLVGNLTRDTETTSGPATTMARMRIATNSSWRDAEGNRQEAAEYHSVVVFGRLAETCGAYALKGRRVYVEGRLRTREYEGGDGLRRHTTEIVADTVRFIDRPGSSDRDPDAEAGAGADPISATPAPENGAVLQSAEVAVMEQPVAHRRRRQAQGSAA